MSYRSVFRGMAPLRMVAVVAAGAMALGVAVLPGAAQALHPGSPNQPAAPAVTEAPDRASALVAAHAQGTTVEDLSARTPTSQTVANPNGTLTTTSYAGVVRSRGDKDGWEAVDADLELDGDSYVPKATAFEASFSSGTDSVVGEATISDAGTVAVGWPAELPKPVVDGNRLTYRGAAQGSDLVVTSNPDGFNFSVMLEEAPSADGGPLEYRVPLEFEGVEPEVNADGSVVLRAGEDRAATLTAPVMWDSSSAGAAARPRAVDATVEGDGTSRVLVLRPDMGYLRDPATVYPVTVDPTLVLNVAGDTWVQSSGDTTSRYTSGELQVGSDDGGATVARSYLYFDFSSVVSPPGAQVTAAEVRLTNFEASSCSGSALRMSRISTGWTIPGLTWSGQPTVVASGASTTVGSAGAPGCPDEELVTFNALPIFATWYSGVTNFGVQIRADNETAATGWRRFRSFENGDLAKVPQFVFTYNTPPTVPTAVGVSPGVLDGSSLLSASPHPEVTATVADPDGSPVSAEYVLKSGSATVATWNSGFVPSGSPVSHRVVPTLADGTYSLSWRSSDGTLSSAWSPAKTVVVDHTAPSPTTVDCTGLSNGSWYETKPAAATTCTITASADTTAVTVTNSGAALPVPPLDSGTTRAEIALAEDDIIDLSVSAQDRAGNQAVTALRAGIGAGRLFQPEAGTVSKTTFDVRATSKGASTGAVLQWRVGGETAWAEASHVTRGSSSWTGTVVSAGGLASTESLVWDADSEPGMPANASLEVRVCFSYDSPAVRCTQPREVTIADNLAPLAVTEVTVSPCVGACAPLVTSSTRPAFYISAIDPEGADLFYRLQVRPVGGGALLADLTSAATPSGGQRSIQLAAGVLSAGTSYEFRAGSDDAYSTTWGAWNEFSVATEVSSPGSVISAKTTLTADTTWTKANSPYQLNAGVTVAAGVRLTLEPGTVIKVTSPMTVLGSLNAVGTRSQPIVFTSPKDDSLGGDSNGDGAATVPGPGDYIGALGFLNIDRDLARTRAGSVLRNVSFRYGAGSVGTHCTTQESVVTIDTLARVRIEHSEFVGLAWGALKVGAIDPEIGSLSVSNSRFGASVNGCILASTRAGTFTDNVFEDTAHANIWVLSTDPRNFRVKFHGNWFFGPITIGVDSYQRPQATRENWDFERNSFLGPWAYQNNSNRQLPDDVTNNWWGQRLRPPPTCNPNPAITYHPEWWEETSFSRCPGLDGWTRDRYAINVLPALGSPPPWPVAGLQADPALQPNLEPDYLLGTGSTEFGQDPTGSQADPVNSAIGSYFEQSTDVAVPALGLDLVVQRTYNSASTAAAGSFGKGWSLGYDQHLSFPSGSAVVFHAGDGQVLRYSRIGDIMTPAAGITAKLSREGTGYRLDTREGLTYSFDTYGRITELEDRHTNAMAFSYSAGGRLASATNGDRELVFTYTGDRLATVKEPGAAGASDDRTTTYGYTDGLLTKVTDASGSVTRYSYDAQKRLKAKKNALSQTELRLAYSPTTGRVTDQWDALDNHTTFQWDPATSTSTMTDPKGHQWIDVYAGTSLIKRVDPAGRTWRYNRDADFQLTRMEDPNGVVTALSYDAEGNITASEGPGGLVTTQHNSLRLPVRTIDARGNIVTMEYNGVGDLTKVSRSVGAIEPLVHQMFTYSPTGLLVTSTDELGHTTHYGYNDSGDQVSVTTPQGKTTTYSYDGGAAGHGLLQSVTTPRGKTTSYSYDQIGRPLAVHDPLGRTASTTYDAAGEVVTQTDAKSRTTTLEYDAAGHVTKVISPDPAALPMTFEYDANGNRTKSTDPLGRVTTTAYNMVNEVTSTTTPSGTWSYTRNKLGLPANITGPDNLTTQVKYDSAGRVTTIDYPGTTTKDVGYTYDANGNRTSMIDAGTTWLLYTYNRLNQIETANRSPGSSSSPPDLRYRYLGNGLLDEIGYRFNGNTVKYAYDEDNQLSSVSTKATATSSYVTQASYTWTDDSLPATAVTGAGLGQFTRTFSYDDANRLSRLQDVLTGGATILDDQFTRDDADNPVAVEHAGGVTDTYEYDLQDRLTKVCYSTSTCSGSTDYIGWTYDAIGNRLTESRPSGTDTYTYAPVTARLTSVTPAGGSPVNYAYDARGQITQAGSKIYSYNLAGRMTADADGTSYTYDGDGRRMTSAKSGVTTTYLWDPKSYNLLNETSSTGTLRNYTYGLGPVSVTEGANSSYFHTDAQGSVRAQTDSAGVGTYAASYDPFGNARSTTGSATSMSFAGQRQDAGGLMHLRARQYDSTTGRFLATDQLATLGESEYSYGSNNPMVNGDSSGLLPSVGDIWNGLQDAAPAVLPVVGMALSFVPGPVGVVALAGMAAFNAYGACTSDKGSCGSAILQNAIFAAGGGIGKVGSRALRNASGELDDGLILVRGGENTPNRFTNGSGVVPGPGGLLSGVSVNGGRTVEAASVGVPNRQIGVTTVGELRRAGGTIVSAPTQNNPNHCLVSGCTAETFSELFSPTVRNPWR